MEAKVGAHYILQTKPDAKIAVLYQNDDFGKDYLKGLKAVSATRPPSMIVKETFTRSATDARFCR